MATGQFSDMDGDHAFDRANAVVAKLSALHQQERRVRADFEKAGELQHPEDEDLGERARRADGRLAHLVAFTRDVVDRRTAANEVGERMRGVAASHVKSAPSMAEDDVAALRLLKWQFIDATHDLRRPEELKGKSVEHPSENAELTIGEGLKNVESMMKGVSAEPERLHPSDAFPLEQLRKIMGDDKFHWSLEDVFKQTRKYWTQAGVLRKERGIFAKVRDNNELYAQELQESKEKHRLSEMRVHELEEELAVLKEQRDARSEESAVLFRIEMAKKELRDAYALEWRPITDEGLNKEISKLQERASKLEESEVALMWVKQVDVPALHMRIVNAEFEAIEEKRKSESLVKDVEREKAAAGKLLAQLATAEVRIMHMEHTEGWVVR
ncbi:hypothetical protein LTR15_002021 [Elasticomyces elasticus]|nr:hypothetical protein LTR15_002021 [Elasticomyces elasticus]